MRLPEFPQGASACAAPARAGQRCAALLLIALLSLSGTLFALESDRQQPLLVDADSTDGTLGDGTAILRGNVEIRQGTLLVRANVAEVEKADGRVRRVLLTGEPVLLQQEIENEGLVRATARKISYRVASGIITLTGAADVHHPQYQVSGEELVYDMNQQHFSGSGDESNGRVRIELAPELVPDGLDASSAPAVEAGPESDAGSETEGETEGETAPDTDSKSGSAATTGANSASH
ncbi:lipopolysaccharide transport periplasmic protein LptA [Elongatibacter sediminis]|uniref:Lipopolysaccharide transport periplasmic protein LptA n=1 Tax=Elongatibacter sediminis TaxID=3119006 RepID=A0AAW9RMX9_9GAMM